MPNKPHIVDIKDFGPGGFKWVTLRRLQYVDQEGRERIWEAAERRTRRGAVDAVAILAKVFSSTEAEKIILVSQFRPPQGQFVIEFPAGLIDDGESASQSAVRELKEETGYSGRVVEESPIIFSDPGLTSSNFQMVTISIDADAEENKNVNPELEEGEFVETLLLPVQGLYQALLKMREERECDLDARLLLYAQGLHDAQQSGSPQSLPAPSSAASASPPDPPAPHAAPASDAAPSSHSNGNKGSDHPAQTPSMSGDGDSRAASTSPGNPDDGTAAGSLENQSASNSGTNPPSNPEGASQSPAQMGHKASGLEQPDSAGHSDNSSAPADGQPLSQMSDEGQAAPSLADASPKDKAASNKPDEVSSTSKADQPASQTVQSEGQQQQEVKLPAAGKPVAKGSFKPAGLRPLPSRPGAKGKGGASGAGVDKKKAPTNGQADAAGSSGSTAPAKPSDPSSQQKAGTSATKWGIEPAPLQPNGKRHAPPSDDSEDWKEDESSDGDRWQLPNGRTLLIAGMGIAAGSAATLLISGLLRRR